MKGTPCVGFEFKGPKTISEILTLAKGRNTRLNATLAGGTDLYPEAYRRSESLTGSL